MYKSILLKLTEYNANGCGYFPNEILNIVKDSKNLFNFTLGFLIQTVPEDFPGNAKFFIASPNRESHTSASLGSFVDYNLRRKFSVLQLSNSMSNNAIIELFTTKHFATKGCFRDFVPNTKAIYHRQQIERRTTVQVFLEEIDSKLQEFNSSNMVFSVLSVNNGPSLTIKRSCRFNKRR